MLSRMDSCLSSWQMQPRSTLSVFIRSNTPLVFCLKPFQPLGAAPGLQLSTHKSVEISVCQCAIQNSPARAHYPNSKKKTAKCHFSTTLLLLLLLFAPSHSQPPAHLLRQHRDIFIQRVTGALQSLNAIQTRRKGVLTKLTEEQLLLLSNSLFFSLFLS